METNKVFYRGTTGDGPFIDQAALSLVEQVVRGRIDHTDLRTRKGKMFKSVFGHIHQAKIKLDAALQDQDEVEESDDQEPRLINIDS